MNPYNTKSELLLALDMANSIYTEDGSDNLLHPNEYTEIKEAIEADMSDEFRFEYNTFSGTLIIWAS